MIPCMFTCLASAMVVPSHNLTLAMSAEFTQPLSVDFSSKKEFILGKKREICGLVWQMSTGPLGGQSSARGHSNVTEKMNFLGHRVPLTQEIDHEGGGRKCHDYKPKGAPTRSHKSKGTRCRRHHSALCIWKPANNKHALMFPMLSMGTSIVKKKKG